MVAVLKNEKSTKADFFSDHVYWVFKWGLGWGERTGPKSPSQVSCLKEDENSVSSSAPGITLINPHIKLI